MTSPLTSPTPSLTPPPTPLVGPIPLSSPSPPAPSRPNLSILTTGISPHEPALFAVDTVTGHREPLLELPEQSMITALAEQPLGPSLLYAVQKESEFGQALWQLDLQTGERRQILERTDGYLISGLAGQPEGTQAVLVLTPLLTSTTGARYPAGLAQDELWLIDTATSTHQQLTPPDTEGELVGWRWPSGAPMVRGSTSPVSPPHPLNQPC